MCLGVPMKGSRDLKQEAQGTGPWGPGKLMCRVLGPLPPVGSGKVWRRSQAPQLGSGEVGMPGVLTEPS